MRKGRTVLYVSAVAAALVIALIAGFGFRDPNGEVAAPPSAAPAPSAPTATTASRPTAAAAGAITGQFRYPAGFIPAMTVYAISVADQRVFFSVDTPRYADRELPAGGATYTITAIAPGTYYVLAYRNSDIPANEQPGLYSQFVLRCVRPAQAGAQPPADCDRSGDHSLVPVTVGAGETVTRIDVADWSYEKTTYPPRPR